MGSIGSLSSGSDVLSDLTKQLQKRDTNKVATFTANVQDVAKDNG